MYQPDEKLVTNITFVILAFSDMYSAFEGTSLLTMKLPSSEGVKVSYVGFFQSYVVLMLTFIAFSLSELCESPFGFTT